MTEKQIFRQNNFDLLRLFAALQVVLNHIIEIMQVHPPESWHWLLRLSHLFPGVPIFFFISGFLISKSYENNHRLSEYFQNRILRLYPGLIVCVGLSFVLIYVSGYMQSVSASWFEWLRLFVAKVTFLQFYNPDFMRGYGDGVLNGSLWTITVELQFYVLIPLIYGFFSLQAGCQCNTRLLMLIVFFLLVNRVYVYIPDQYHTEIWYKLFRVSFLPWFYMFLVGIFVQKNFAIFHKILAGRFVWLFIGYCAVGLLALHFRLPLGNNVNPVMYMLLVLLVFSFAYSAPGLSRRLLKGNDISYGVYIYHMPVVNYLLYRGYAGVPSAAVAAFVLTVLAAWFSWVLIEKNSLKLKRHPLNPLNSAAR